MTHKNSLFDKMKTLLPYESLLIECDTRQQATNTHRQVSALSRYPDCMKGRKYTGTIAVTVWQNGDTKQLLKITRIL